VPLGISVVGDRTDRLANDRAEQVGARYVCASSGVRDRQQFRARQRLRGARRREGAAVTARRHVSSGLQPFWDKDVHRCHGRREIDGDLRSRPHVPVYQAGRARVPCRHETEIRESLHHPAHPQRVRSHVDHGVDVRGDARRRPPTLDAVQHHHLTANQRPWRVDRGGQIQKEVPQFIGRTPERRQRDVCHVQSWRIRTLVHFTFSF
jgi:hypothetical protein